MFLSSPTVREEAERMYQNDIKEMGFVMNLSRLWAWRPDVCEDFAALRSKLMTGSSLSPRELTILACTTARTLGDSYCALAWGNRLASLSDSSTAVAILQSSQAGHLTERERALRVWAEKVVTNPNGTTSGDVQDLLVVGISEREAFEATLFVSFRLAFSSINSSLGVRPDWQLARDASPDVLNSIKFGRPVAESPT